MHECAHVTSFCIPMQYTHLLSCRHCYICRYVRIAAVSIPWPCPPNSQLGAAASLGRFVRVTGFKLVSGTLHSRRCLKAPPLNLLGLSSGFVHVCFCSHCYNSVTHSLIAPPSGHPVSKTPFYIVQRGQKTLHLCVLPVYVSRVS